jgi:hypothetical protein
MAKFLIDENISPKTLQFLTELESDVTTLKSRGITDEEVVAQAKKQKESGPDMKFQQIDAAMQHFGLIEDYETSLPFESQVFHPGVHFLLHLHSLVGLFHRLIVIDW